MVYSRSFYQVEGDMRRTVSAPPGVGHSAWSQLAPLSSCHSTGHWPPGHSDHSDTGCVYFPVDVDIESLMDWKIVNEKEQNNNFGQFQIDDLEKAALVDVNKKEIAVFKYGNDIIGKEEKIFKPQ